MKTTNLYLVIHEKILLSGKKLKLCYLDIRIPNLCRWIVHILRILTKPIWRDSFSCDECRKTLWPIFLFRNCINSRLVWQNTATVCMDTTDLAEYNVKSQHGCWMEKKCDDIRVDLANVLSYYCCWQLVSLSFFKVDLYVNREYMMEVKWAWIRLFIEYICYIKRS